MPHNVSLSLYKAYLLPHLEYRSPLLIGINKTLNSKLESDNKYALKTPLNLGNNLDYNTILSLSDMQSLEHRRYYSSLVLLYKCINSNGRQCNYKPLDRFSSFSSMTSLTSDLTQVEL